MAEFNGVYDAHEIKTSIGSYNGTTWDFEEVMYLRDFQPTLSNNKRKVFNRKDYKGSKEGRADGNEISITQEFMGYDSTQAGNLYKYESTDKLVVKREIVPDSGVAPTDNAIYYWNWSTNEIPDPSSDDGEFTVSLSGDMGKKSKYPPTDDTFTAEDQS